MSFNTDWDVDQYRMDHESEEHWQLRRDFMVTHKDKFPEERLVCLAQVFTNVEFMGCRYPAETMQLVEQLSEGIADDYREKQKSKLQRTFVKASDAAGAKVKGLKRPATEEATPLNSPPKISKNTENTETSQNPPHSGLKKPLPKEVTPFDSNLEVPMNSENTEAQPAYTPLLSPVISSETANLLFRGKKMPAEPVPSKSSSSQGMRFVPPEKVLNNTHSDKLDDVEDKVNGCSGNSSFEAVMQNDASIAGNSDAKALKREFRSLTRKPSQKIFTPEFYEPYKQLIEKIDTTKFGKLILLESEFAKDAFGVLQRSCAGCNIPWHIEYEESSSVFCRIYVNKLLVVSAFDAVRRVARDVAAYHALEKLKDVCYSLTIKKRRIPDDLIVNKEMINSIICQEVERSKPPIAKTQALPLRLPEDNIGSKLMRSMGWSGGGLGKAEQGIQEPVSVSLQLSRAGLGARDAMSKGVVETAFKSKARIYLSQFVLKDLALNLIFKYGEFSFLELSVVQLLAKSMGLQCCSYKKDGRLEISKKETLELIAIRMLQKGVYSDEYFELQEPRNRKVLENFESETLKASDFPCLVRIDNFSGFHKEYLMVASESPVKTKERPMKSLSKKERKGIKILQKELRKSGNSKEMKDAQDALAIEENKHYSLEAIAAGPYGSFFLVEHENSGDSAWSIMIESAAKNSVPMRYEFGSFKGLAVTDKLILRSCKVFVNNYLLTSYVGPNKKVARANAVNDAYEKLKQICYVLKVKQKFQSDEPLVEKPTFLGQEIPTSEGNSVDRPLEENIGSKLMRAMGWTGGGLGKEKQGIEEPVSIKHRVCRTGLGLDTDVSNNNRKVNRDIKFRGKVFALLRDYIKKDTLYDLIFSSDFTKPERALMHEIAKRLGLGSKSYGKDNDRSLVISKKKNYRKIVEEMLRTGEYSSPFYELVKPPISLPPDHNCQPDILSNERSENMLANPIDFDSRIKVASVCQPSKEQPHEVSTMAVQNEDAFVEKKSDPVFVELDVNGVNKLPQHQINTQNNITNLQNSVNAEPYGQLVLQEDENCLMPILIIERSANACHIPFKLEYGKVKGGMICKLYVNNILVTSNTETSKKKARELSVHIGLKKLKDKCCSLKTEMKIEGNWLRVTRCLNKPNSFGSGGSGPKNVKKIICNSKQLDWLSLGLESRVKDISQTEFKIKIRNFLCGYLVESYPYDLVVPPDFTAQEMTIIQQAASNLGLKVTKYHLAQKDFLLISKKLSLIEMAQAMLKNEGGQQIDSLQTSTAGDI